MTERLDIGARNGVQEYELTRSKGQKTPIVVKAEPNTHFLVEGGGKNVKFAEKGWQLTECLPPTQSQGKRYPGVTSAYHYDEQNKLDSTATLIDTRGVYSKEPLECPVK